MVRPKRQISAEKRAELDKLMNETKEKFAMDLKELELVKRHFSLAFIEAMKDEFAKLFDKEELNMKLADFVKHLEAQANALDEQQNVNREGHHNVLKNAAHTPAVPRRPLTYKTMRTPAGLNIKVPSCITPKVDSGIARLGKLGEMLFSVHGTPVMQPVGAHNTTEEAVHDWLHQEEEELTPHTREIIVKLKNLVHVKATSDNGEKSEDEQ